MQKQRNTGEKIQEILTDRKTLSGVAAFILIYALLVAFWRREKKNKERQSKIYEKIEKAGIKGNELGVDEEERRDLAQYVVEQDLAGRLPAFIKQVLARMKFQRPNH